LIHHSDRGSQYAAGDYRALLKASGIVPSMSRKGNCWDNAPMESWFHTLKTELVHHAAYATHEAAKRDLFAYIAYFGVFGGRFRSNPAGDFAAKRHPLGKDSRCPPRRVAADEVILSCRVH
jgi:transposase InsO family protein